MLYNLVHDVYIRKGGIEVATKDDVHVLERLLKNIVHGENADKMHIDFFSLTNWFNSWKLEGAERSIVIGVSETAGMSGPDYYLEVTKSGKVLYSDGIDDTAILHDPDVHEAWSEA